MVVQGIGFYKTGLVFRADDWVGNSLGLDSRVFLSRIGSGLSRFGSVLRFFTGLFGFRGLDLAFLRVGFGWFFEDSVSDKSSDKRVRSTHTYIGTSREIVRNRVNRKFLFIFLVLGHSEVEKGHFGHLVMVFMLRICFDLLQDGHGLIQLLAS